MQRSIERHDEGSRADAPAENLVFVHFSPWHDFYGNVWLHDGILECRLSLFRRA